MEKDKVFLITYLFRSYEWNRIPLKDMLLLGALFLSSVNEPGGSIGAVEKTSSTR